jgi:hypothetical protein
MRQTPLVVDRHRIDVDGSAQKSVWAAHLIFTPCFATHPLSICLAMRNPRARFSVNTAPERP